MYDGTIVVLHAKPGLNGDAYYTRKGNYGLNLQVCDFSIRLLLSDISIYRSAIHLTHFTSLTTRMDSLALLMMPMPLSIQVLPSIQIGSLKEQSLPGQILHIPARCVLFLCIASLHHLILASSSSTSLSLTFTYALNTAWDH